MAVKLRLRRTGARNQPRYRIVAADSRSPRDGRFIEVIGHYNPTRQPHEVAINEERALKWLRRGAQPSDTVGDLLVQQGIMAKFYEAQGKPVPPEAMPRPVEAPAEAPRPAAAEPEESAQPPAEVEAAAAPAEPPEGAAEQPEEKAEPAAEAEAPTGPAEPPPAAAERPAEKAEPAAEAETPEAAPPQQQREPDEASAGGEAEPETDESSEETQTTA